MSLTLAIALNAVLDLGVIATVALVMSRAARLTPHRDAAAVPSRRRGPEARRSPGRRSARDATALPAHS